MAEARRAIETLPALTLETSIDPTNHHVQANVSSHGVSLFVPAPRFILRNAVQSFKRLVNKIHQAFIPLPLPFVITLVSGAVTVVLLSPSSSSVRDGWLGNFLWNIDNKIPFVKRLPVWWRVSYLTFNASVTILLGFTACHRLLLRALLSYHGWMDEVRGKKSLKTTVWGALLKYIYVRGGSKVMLAYQTSLPHLPLPTLRDTAKRYMESMEPLLTSPQERLELQAKLDEFLGKEGPKLQRLLFWKRMFSRNYINDWWLKFVYLRGRESVMINSNFYGLSVAKPSPTHLQACRAAYCSWLMANVMLEVDSESIAPQLIQGLVPLCMQQYTMAFGTTRIPQPEMDKIVHYSERSECRHILVMHRGRFYRVKMFSDTTGQTLSYMQLYNTLQGILDDKAPASEPEQQLAALTAANRTTWATVRERFFLRNSVNRVALETIEKAAFVVVLDDDDAEWNDFSRLASLYAHGNGCNRWYDKSFNLIFSPTGYLGINGEHAWGDAPCLGHLFELVMAREITREPYNDDGTLKPDPVFVAREKCGKARNYPAERLTFAISEPLRNEISSAARSAKEQLNDLHIVVSCYDKFGKGLMKKAKCSPDAFIQLVLQVAFYRNQGKFVQTYESSTTRLYVDGRTETIRSCTSESTAFVLALEEFCGKATTTTATSKTTTKEQLQKLAQKACEKHAKLTAYAMTGRGVDRHLFGLYVVAVGTNTESPFLKSAMSRGWKLSTSQIPQQQTEGEWPTPAADNQERWPRCSGGFGPVCDDGYGVSYVIAGESRIFFHVSGKRSCPTTDSEKMLNDICSALSDVGALFRQ